MEEKIDNIRQIDISVGYKVMENYEYNKLISNKKNILSIMSEMTQVVRDTQQEELLVPDVQQLINNKSEKFDLLMIEVSSHIALADRFNVPIIAVSSMDAILDIHRIMGNDVHPLLHSDRGGALGYQHPLSITQRIVSWNSFSK